MLKKRLKVILLVLSIIIAIPLAWNMTGLPVPASAEDIRILTRGQAKIGIAVHEDRGKDFRREKRELEIMLDELEYAKQTAIIKRQKRRVTTQIQEIQVEYEKTIKHREKYEKQFIAAER